MATWGSADYRQLERLRENLAKLQGADMDKFCTDVSRELAGRLLALVIPRTPVGRKPTLEQLGGKEAKATVKTKLRDAQGRLRTRSFLSREGAILQQYWSGYMGGTLRRGWTTKNEEAAAKPGGGMTAKAYAQTLPVTKAGGVYQITVINPVKYASYVEFGHRQKPGRYDALGTVLCGRGDDLRGGRRADSGGPAGRALPCRNPQCHGGIFGDDAVGCIAGNVTVCDMWRNVAE